MSAFVDPPLSLPDVNDCYFYHTIDLPGIGIREGQWDLRPGIRKYLGDLDFRGKRVLEIGTASGYVCFELERRGADVVAFDLPEDAAFDAPPVDGNQAEVAASSGGTHSIRNAFWLAHRLMGSRARLAVGHANDLPASIGEFDVVVIANVLQHLRDPVGAVMQAARIARTVVVTEADWMAGKYDDLQGMIYFGQADHPFSWYQVKPRLVESVLTRMGLQRSSIVRHEQLFVQDVSFNQQGELQSSRVGRKVPHFTVTASRRI